jgi:hypothetical protein
MEDGFHLADGYLGAYRARLNANLALLVNAGTGRVIRDGVDRSSRPASRVFPYLSPANPTPPQPPEHV